MKDFNTTFFTVFFAFCGIMVLRSIYKTFIVKAKTPQDYMKKANYAVSFFKARGYAYNLLNDALEKFPNLSEEEKSFINFQMGLIMYYKKKYAEAVKHYEIAWPYLKKAKIPYSRIYASIVLSYYNIGDKTKAREIYHYLRQKEKYDAKFYDLQYLERMIFK